MTATAQPGRNTVQSHRHRWRDAARGMGALLGVLVLVVVVPALLIVWVGWPLPADMPTVSAITDALRDTYIPDEFLLKVLAIVCWLVWVELVASLIVESIAYIQGRRATPVPLAGGVQRAAARLVASVALLGALVSTKGVPEIATQTLRPLVPKSQAGVTLVVDGPDGATSKKQEKEKRTPAPPPRVMYEVQRRDTLWDIAERYLGDPFRWPEIFEANKSRTQPDGRCLTNPDLIYPGWQFELPADAAGVAVAPPSEPAPVEQPPPSPGPVPEPDPVDDGFVLIDETSGSDTVLAARSPGTDSFALVPDPLPDPGGSAAPTTEPPTARRPDE